MALLDSLLNLVKSNRMTDDEVMQMFNSVKERYPDIFDLSLKKIKPESLTENLTQRPFLNRYVKPAYRWGSTNLKLNENLEPYLYLNTKEKPVVEEPVVEEPEDQPIDERFDKIAVGLIGEWRTGSIVAKYMHRFFNSMAKQVDYYIVTYNNVTLETVLESYPQAVVKLISREQSDTWPAESIFLRRAAICAELLELIEVKLTEYDQIVETRPDLYMRNLEKQEIWGLNETDKLVRCKENEGTNCHIWYRQNSNPDAASFAGDPDIVSKLQDADQSIFHPKETTDPSVSTMDTYIRLHPQTFKKYANRYHEYKDNENFHYFDPHKLTAKCMVDNQIKCIGWDFLLYCIIRNEHCNYINLDHNTQEQLDQLNPKPVVYNGAPKW